MFKALGRFFRAIGHVLTGKIDSSTKGLNENPAVVRSRYDEIIEKKRESILQVRNAVAGLIRNIERKRSELHNTNEEIAQKERLMNGAKAMAAKVAKGKSREEAQQDAEFVKCMRAYQDFKSSLELLHQRKEGLEADVAQTEQDSKGYEVQLQSLHREMKDMLDERERSVADVAMARETRAANEALAGIANDGTADDMRRLRESVAQAKAEAQVTSRLAGTDTARQEAEFLEMAGSMEAESEFMDDVFGSDVSADAGVPETSTQATKKETLPE
jgi:chromosome segregation ATPase